MNEAAESNRLVKQNLDLLESGNFADAEITCKEKVWKVHKVILQSRCAWFEKAFANNWQEAQTGRIHLEEEQPEKVDGLLKFIYSGRFAPELPHAEYYMDQFIPGLHLESIVSLWRTADYFLLPDLKDAIHEYLSDWLASTLCYFHRKFYTYTPIGRSPIYVPYWAGAQGELFNCLFRAVKNIYKCPTARKLQKLLTVFACGLREHLPNHILWDLVRTPGFQQDMCNALIALNFPQATNGTHVAMCLEPFHHCPSNRSDCWTYRGKISEVRLTMGTMALDPLSLGEWKCCRDCAFFEFRLRLKVIIREWPAEADQMGLTVTV